MAKTTWNPRAWLSGLAKPNEDNLQDLSVVLDVPNALDALHWLIEFADKHEDPDYLRSLFLLPRNEALRELFRHRTALAFAQQDGQVANLTIRQWCQGEVEQIAHEDEDHAENVLDWCIGLVAKLTPPEMLGDVISRLRREAQPSHGAVGDALQAKPSGHNVIDLRRATQPNHGASDDAQAPLEGA